MIKDELNKEFIEAYQKQRKQTWREKLKPQWKTLEGKIIQIKDMDTTHIVNAINHLRKSGRSKIQAVVNDREGLLYIHRELEKELESRNFDDWYMLSPKFDGLW